LRLGEGVRSRGVRIKVGLAEEERGRWEALWSGLADVGELSNREAEIVADTARRGIAANFEEERAPDGTPWAPLAPRTQEERRKGIDARGVPFRTGSRHPILKRTGDLKESFTDPRHPRNVTEVERGGGVTAVVLGAKDDPRTPGRIETLHAGGFTETGAPVPARPFVGLSDRHREQVEEQARRVVWQRVERLRGI